MEPTERQMSGEMRLPNGQRIWLNERGEVEIPVEDASTYAIPLERGDLDHSDSTLEFSVKVNVRGRGSVDTLAGLLPALGNHRPGAVDGTRTASYPFEISEYRPNPDTYDGYPDADSDNKDLALRQPQTLSTISPEYDDESFPASPAEIRVRKRHASRLAVLGTVAVVIAFASGPTYQAAHDGDAAAKKCSINPVCLTDQFFGNFTASNFFNYGSEKK